MTLVYAESSAVLRWLLGADSAGEIQTTLAGAQAVVSSALTSTEVARTLRRLEASQTIDARARESAWARYTSALGHWHVYAVSEPVLTRAAQAFPMEPVGTLDALHLATALLFSSEVARLVVLSVDRRVRDNAQTLGLHIMPPSA